MNLCDRFPAEVLSYLDGRLDAEASERWRRHMEQCSVCMSRLNDVQQTDALLKTMPRETAPSTLGDRMMACLDRDAAALKRRKRLHVWAWSSAAAMGLVAVLTVFMLQWKESGASRPLSIVKVESGEVQWTPDRVATTPQQRGRVLLSDGSMLDVAEDTGVRISPEGTARVIRLEHGMVTCYAKPSDRPFIIKSPLADIHVLGTVFMVKMGFMKKTKTERVQALLVGVTMGTVRMVNARGQRQATAGEAMLVYDKSSPIQTSDPMVWRGFDMDWNRFTIHDWYR